MLNVKIILLKFNSNVLVDFPIKINTAPIIVPIAAAGCMNDRCNFDKWKMLNITLIGMFSIIDLLIFYVFEIIKACRVYS